MCKRNIRWKTVKYLMIQCKHKKSKLKNQTSTTIKQKVNVCAILTRHILQQNFKRQLYFTVFNLISDFFRNRLFI